MQRFAKCFYRHSLSVQFFSSGEHKQEGKEGFRGFVGVSVSLVKRITRLRSRALFVPNPHVMHRSRKVQAKIHEI